MIKLTRIAAKVNSLTAFAFAAPVCVTMTPRSRAATRSTLSTPVPCRAITRRFGDASITAAVIPSGPGIRQIIPSMCGPLAAQIVATSAYGGTSTIVHPASTSVERQIGSIRGSTQSTVRVAALIVRVASRCDACGRIIGFPSVQ